MLATFVSSGGNQRETGQTQARVGCAARSRQGSVEWVSEQRAHSIGLAAAAVLVAPLLSFASGIVQTLHYK